jgi:hypothetical protein
MRLYKSSADRTQNTYFYKLTDRLCCEGASRLKSFLSRLTSGYAPLQVPD